MIESVDWYFALAVMLGVMMILGIFSVILFIAISPLYVNKKNINQWWVYLLFRLSSRDREQNFTPRELIMARALLLFMLGALAFHLLSPV